jgi:hypothetical protein
MRKNMRMGMDRIEKVNRIEILSVVMLGAALFAFPVHAQNRGMGGVAPGPRLGNQIGLGLRRGFAHSGRRNFFAGSTFLPYGCFDPAPYEDDDMDSREASPPVQVYVAPPAQPPVPPRPPADSLLLEFHDGQYVRIPTGGHLPNPPELMSGDSSQAPGVQPGVANQKEAALRAPVLPRAVLLFRDGRKEEIERYVIQNDVIYAGSDYWSTGSWTQKIPIAQLDVPATLKLNQQRGAKFTLPSGPGEIAVRF